MKAPDCDVVVVGAGAAGLAAARTLEAAGRSVVVLDANSAPGGVMQTAAVRGYRIECGPNTVLVRAPAHRFLRDHDLLGALEKASPASRTRWLYRDGQLLPVPDGPLSLVSTPLLSGRGKRRLLAEPFVRKGDAQGESVAEFVGRRLGDEAALRLVGPFLTGVYAGDERRLGAEAVFPSLVELERSHGSIVRGALAGALRGLFAKKELGSLRGSYSGRGGFSGFAQAMADGLRDLRLASPVERIAKDASRWRVETANGALSTAKLLLAVPAQPAARLLAPVARDAAAELAAIEYAPIAVVAFGADPKEIRASTEGFGFLVPREEKLGLLGCLFPSRLFSGRAPEGRVLLHCMAGGTRFPEAVDLADDELERSMLADLDRTLGLRTAPELLLVSRWPRAVPQPGRDHRARIERVRRSLGGAPVLEIAGSHTDGVSVGDSLASGVAAAKRLLARD